ncbi:MAG: dihydroorotate dehydrogenase [Candidatus Omnitrophica bacterium]|nr:dihydroorotate dehydrogenase [Candidatus Omnitrophota bacterium]
MNLSVKLGSLNLKNPVTVASGTFGYAYEFAGLVRLKDLGAIVTKTITRNPKPGNPTPRLAETPAGMLNAIGLQNEGLDNFLEAKLPMLKKIGTKIIVSISANCLDDFIFCVKKLQDSGVEAIELNLSCPNIKYTGLNDKNKSVMFAQDEKATFKAVEAVRNNFKGTLITKLSPNVTDIGAIGKSAEQAGSDALSLVNTFTAMAIDINTGRPKLANITGGLSGPAIRPIAVRMVYEVCRHVKIPVIGMGGIMNSDDALEFMIAGAVAVSVGTANFVNPKASMDIIKGLKDYCVRKKINDINKIIGTVKL